MNNRVLFFLPIVLLFCQVEGFSQAGEGRRVAIYVDPAQSTFKDAVVYKNVRGTFHNILDANGYEIAPDSTASRMANEYRKGNYIRTGIAQGKKITELLYLFTVDTIDDNLQLSVSVIEVEQRKEPQNKKSYISRSFFSKHKIKCTDLIAYDLAHQLGLITTVALNNQLVSLNKWKENTMREEKGIVSDEKMKYTALSLLPPVNQFSSKTQKGKANGIAILAGYGISVGSFIYCTASYNANKRKYEGVTIDLSEADKAREHYKGQMDLCRTGQIASGILLAGTYVYGVANALINRGAYQDTPRESGMIIAPTAYGNGAGLALVYRF